MTHTYEHAQKHTLVQSTHSKCTTSTFTHMHTDIAYTHYSVRCWVYLSCRWLWVSQWFLSIRVPNHTWLMSCVSLRLEKVHTRLVTTFSLSTANGLPLYLCMLGHNSKPWPGSTMDNRTVMQAGLLYSNRRKTLVNVWYFFGDVTFST